MSEKQMNVGKISQVMGSTFDVQFQPGVFIPMALNAWDGSNGEHGLIMSLSSWYFVFLEAPTPTKIYLYAIFAFLITGGLGLWLMRKAIQSKEPEEAEV